MRVLLAALLLAGACACVAAAAVADGETLVAMPRFVLAAGPLAAGPGGETLVATPRFVPAAGPLAAGPGGVAWVSRRDDRVLDLWVAAPGQGPSRVQRFSAGDDERLIWPRLAASSTTVGLEALVVGPSGRMVQRLAYAGPFGEPLQPAEIPLAPAAAPAGPAVHVARGCESAEIHTGLPAPARLREPACGLRLRSPLRLRGDRLRFGISCAGFRIECSALVVVRAGGRVVARGPARYNHATPPYAAASLRVDPAARELLRAGRSVRVTARIERAVTRTTSLQFPAARR